MFKKIIALGVLLIILSFAGCGCMNVSREFDLTDPKEYWKGNIDEDFNDDSVLIILRKTSTFPELKLRHFRLDNAESLEYLTGVRPPDYFFKEEYQHLLVDYRQIVCIKLKQHGKEKVIDAIKQLEELDFVKRASPNHILGPA